MHYTVHDKVKAKVSRSTRSVFLRQDFERLGTYRQISRALKELEQQAVLVRAGHGIYTKPALMERPEHAIAEIRKRLGERINRLVTLGNRVVEISSRKKSLPNAQDQLDSRKLQSAQHVLALFDLSEIRRISLENIHRWKSNGLTVSALDEWQSLMEKGSDEEVIAVMTGTDEKSNRLRQSSPYVGLLDRSS